MCEFSKFLTAISIVDHTGSRTSCLNRVLKSFIVDLYVASNLQTLIRKSMKNHLIYITGT